MRHSSTPANPDRICVIQSQHLSVPAPMLQENSPLVVGGAAETRAVDAILARASQPVIEPIRRTGQDRRMQSYLMPDPAPDALAGMLVAVGRDRDKRAFRALFAHFAPRVKSYLIRTGSDGSQAEEVVQEVMVAVWRRAETFDPAQASAATWVFTVARNKRIDLIRKERRPAIDVEDPTVPASIVPIAQDASDKVVGDRQTAAKLKAALEALPPEQRQLVELAYYDDKPHSQIAEECNLPLGTVKSRIRLALSRLRKVAEELE